MKRSAHRPQVSNTEHRKVVHLELTDTPAKEVCVAGGFNDWHPSVTPMFDAGGGRWVKEITLPPGRHEYLFVVDGQWRCDPRAKERVPNPFGGMNCVIEVP
jgi:1,4-alpha-glucan branching enzyme